uniref:Uncharacterized protein n=1 Tax=Romanomermis culicivorax TaxID=13658 RepID=A0A915IJJ0_ROMCU
MINVPLFQLQMFIVVQTGLSSFSGQLSGSSYFDEIFEQGMDPRYSKRTGDLNYSDLEDFSPIADFKYECITLHQIFGSKKRQDLLRFVETFRVTGSNRD